MNHKIGDKLIELRTNNKNTQQDIADYLGFNSRNTVGKWERNESEPSYEDLVKLAALFNVKIGYFFEEEDAKSEIDSEIQEKILYKILKDLEYEDVLKDEIDEDKVLRLKNSLNRYINSIKDK